MEASCELFPFKSRMQVNEGTYGVFLQNGICKEPCLPGDYLLRIPT